MAEPVYKSYWFDKDPQFDNSDGPAGTTPRSDTVHPQTTTPSGVPLGATVGADGIIRL